MWQIPDPRAVTCLSLRVNCSRRCRTNIFQDMCAQTGVPADHGVALYHVSAKVGTMSRLVLTRRDELGGNEECGEVG